MISRSIKFSKLKQLLAEAGFREVVVSDGLLGFQHDGSDTLIVLPEYSRNAEVAAHHLAQVRVALDAKGLVDAAELDRRLGETPRKHPASS